MRSPLWTCMAGLGLLVSTHLLATERVITDAVPSGSVLAHTRCADDPLQGRPLYLRGTFNSWSAPDAQRFTWACNRYELVTRLTGEHRFKIGDEAWSADADFGRGSSDAQLAIKGPEFRHVFSGDHRLTLRVNTSNTPAVLGIEQCPVAAPPGRHAVVPTRNHEQLGGAG